MSWTIDALIFKYTAWKMDKSFPSPMPTANQIRNNPKLYLPGLKILGDREGWFQKGDTVQL